MNVTKPEIVNLSAVNTYSVDFSNMTETILITGTNASVNVIGTTGTANEYTVVDITFLGSVTGVGTLSIFGNAINASLLTTKFSAKAIYESGAWTLYIIGSLDTAFITNSNVAGTAAISLSKLAALTATRIPQINASGIIEPSAVNSSFIALLGALTASAAEYNKVAAFTGSTANLNRIDGGTWTAAELQFLAGVTSSLQTQLNAKANTSDFSGLISLRQFDVTIPSAQVLTANATPITLVAAQGANTIIRPLEVTANMVYSGTPPAPYATNGDLVINNGGTREIFDLTAAAFLFGTVSRTVNFRDSQIAVTTATAYVANSPLTLQVSVGNPVNGTSNIRIFGTFYVKTL